MELGAIASAEAPAGVNEKGNVKNSLHHVAENIRPGAYLQISLKQEGIQLDYGTKFLPEDLGNLACSPTADGVNSMGT